MAAAASRVVFHTVRDSCDSTTAVARGFNIDVRSCVLACACAADIEEVDAVISTIGGSTKDPTADSLGNINVIEAAAAKGVKKFILVTSIGCGDSKDAPGEQVYKVLEPVLLQKDKAEERLKVRWDGCGL